MEIVQDYSDHGRSGLNIAGREGLNQLMADVEAKRTNFTSLLVYHVSRWGRFQDVDESAYYEYVLKRAGIRVGSAKLNGLDPELYLRTVLPASQSTPSAVSPSCWPGISLQL